LGLFGEEPSMSEEGICRQVERFGDRLEDPKGGLV
jgi:hypothetical protein